MFMCSVYPRRRHAYPRRVDVADSEAVDAALDFASLTGCRLTWGQIPSGWQATMHLAGRDLNGFGSSLAAAVRAAHNGAIAALTSAAESPS
jgi:hypothetical protein